MMLVLPVPGKTGDENIEAGFVHAEAEFDGADRAILADEIFQRRHFRRAGKRQIGQIAAPSEFVVRHFETDGSSRIPLW